MPAAPSGEDVRWMRHALALAEQGLGLTAPNPSVGCVLVKDGRLIAAGVTAEAGRPHAERVALDRAGEAARGATAYVTLAPCTHEGQTGPCAEALVEAGIARLVFAVDDPNPDMRSQGEDRFIAAGIAASKGVLAAEATALNRGFFLTKTENRPLVTCKLASSLDGRIALSSGESQWITGPQARQDGHRLRLHHDAIMVGSETVLQDDPALTCRLPGLPRRTPYSPVRVVMDSRLRLPVNSGLAQTAGQVPTWVITDAPRKDVATARLAMPAGVDIISVPDTRDIRTVLAHLAERGITRLLVEGGGTLVASVIQAGLVDHLVQYQAPKVIGADGRPVVGPLGLANLDGAPTFTGTPPATIGKDLKWTMTREE
ncbi:bifunctional diaminohydroxyphosphoribosylaminopyrimidine deaminase/5-amino-6-(5-phosphoribosylamino)uracil reductase RibD [Yunchengibacter salinarum]|uniref:bifunctional diaminohydroxyphosphoribosylaminopyrimidine deaminase/5-amino-6-(5-phosphoribosylamino)uracil reductase RibD n=1 Tax=Yunchengibacter salinarum TaxID=3133399 RepID=UPI0035B606A8